MLDQDTPAPPGDDVDVPESSDIERITDRFIASVTVTVEPPTSDAVLARGTTNFDGRVMIMLTPGQAANPAGHVVTTISTENLRTGDIETRSTRSPVTESAPDIYFRVFALGDDDDTKSKPGGVTVNLRSKHLGTPTQPVQFRVRISPGTVLGR